MTIKELHQLYRSGAKSPVETVNEALDHIAAWQDKTHLFITVNPEAALAEARASEARYQSGAPLSILDGVLVGLKDLIDLKGEITTAGSQLRLDVRARQDAPVAARLRESGANLALGKLNLHEFAYGPTGASSYFGPVGNPYDASRMAGGSSSGSAVAVASGVMAGALGTDTGGSVRIPAAFSGVTGLKPTYGAVSTEGVVPLSWSLDHVGPLARTAADVRLLWEVIHDANGSDDRLPDRPLKLFVVDDPNLACYDAGLQQHIEDGIRAIGDEFGASIERGELMEVNQLWLSQSIILGSEALAYHWSTLATNRDAYQPDVAERLVAGGSHLAAEYIAAMRYRQVIQRRYREWLRAYDALILPTVPIQAPALDTTRVQRPDGRWEDVRATVTRFTNPFNLLGFPALAIPWGLYRDLPTSLQLVAGPGREALLLGIGELIQTHFPESLPPIPSA
ncbi:amidase [Sulfobacillus harzensis]|uniref:Amidase n=1 Tax=Sulfobacillus harzensis TaxID=2729629 RepID=A0A7Y0Q3M4_9FIRM|nr:amidase [Sulfobacillus harzensis]NMP22324.1 amidase [Sulfobacillus harzensis]